VSRKPLTTGLDNIWVVVPTYNEAGNVAALVKQVLEVLPSAHLVVVDDASPDGTSDIVKKFAQQDKRVHLLCRPAKLGYASAVATGLKFALSNGACIVGYMDADFSHDPHDLPLLVAEVLKGADIVIGSRYVVGGRIIGWSWQRKVLSQWANWLVRFLLRLPVHDSTSGFRLFRREALERLQLERVKVNGYAFQFVGTAMAVWEGLKVVEVPITFRERKCGCSKMSWRIIAEAAIVLLALTCRCRAGNRLAMPILWRS